MSGSAPDLVAALQALRADHDLDVVTAMRELPDGAVLTIAAWRGGINTIRRGADELRVVPPEARA